MGFWNDWLRHRREVRVQKEKNTTKTTSVIKKSKPINGLTLVISVFFICVAVFLSFLAVAAGKAVEKVGSSTASASDSVLSKYPEMALLYSNPGTEMQKWMIGSLVARNVKASVDFKGDIQVKPVTIIEKRAVKSDPRCIDKYTYEQLESFTTENDIRVHRMGLSDVNYFIQKENLSDKGCAYFSTVTEPYNATDQSVFRKTVDLYKCPVRNCVLEVQSIERLEDVIPTTMNMNSLRVDYNK